jgi:hypothetical protein
MQHGRSECAEIGADAIVPEGDANEPLYLARDTSSMPRHPSEVMLWERLFQLTRRGGSAGEPERMPASKPVSRSGWR